jgi:transcriptional regulator with XRE-family HTH domain
MFPDVPCIMLCMSRQGDRRRVARYVAARRGALGLSQEELATKAAVDTKTIYNLESGERWPQAKTRSKIEAALGWLDADMVHIAEGGEPTLADDLTEAAGTDRFERTVRQAISRLPEAERSVVEDLLAEHLTAQQKNQQIIEKLIVLLEHRGNSRQRSRDDLADDDSGDTSLG